MLNRIGALSKVVLEIGFGGTFGYVGERRSEGREERRLERIHKTISSSSITNNLLLVASLLAPLAHRRQCHYVYQPLFP